MTASDTPVPSASLRDYGVLVRRQWWILALAALLGLAAAAGYTATEPKTYTSVTDVLVTATGVEDDSVSANARTRTEINLDTEAQLLKSTAVLTRAREQLGSPLTLEALADRVSVSVPPNTEVLTIGFRGPSPQSARDGAEAVATAYLANRAAEAAGNVAARQNARQAQVVTLTRSLQEVTATLAGLREGSAERSVAEAQVQSISAQIAVLTAESNELDSFAPTPGKVITDASLPASPSSPVVVMNLAGGAMLGLLVGVGVAVLRQRRDRELHDAAQVSEVTGLPVLLSLPTLESPDVADPAGAEGRAYIRLRNVLGARGAVTSGGPGVAGSTAVPTSTVVLVAGVQADGSAVATNLAVALARSGASVVLVGTHAESRVGRRLGLQRRGEGLSELLERPSRLTKSGIRPVPAIPGLSVILPGRDPVSAAGLMQTELGADLVLALRDMSRYVVLDAPPTELSSQAQSVAALSDARVLVVTAGITSRAQALEAVEQFRAVDAPLLGAILLPAPPGQHWLRRRAGRDVPPAVDEAELTVDELAEVRDGSSVAGLTADEPAVQGPRRRRSTTRPR